MYTGVTHHSLLDSLILSLCWILPHLICLSATTTAYVPLLTSSFCSHASSLHLYVYVGLCSAISVLPNPEPRNFISHDDSAVLRCCILTQYVARMDHETLKTFACVMSKGPAPVV
jgi:hypothetical protein